MWSKILLLICQADIRNPLRYLLITESLLRSLSEGACTPSDTSKSPSIIYCFSQLKQGIYLIRLNSTACFRFQIGNRFLWQT